MTPLQQLQSEFPRIKAHAPTNSWDAFFIQEVTRFYSIAGTIDQTFKNVATNIDERIISHILIRSLIENCFKILYIYDNSNTSQARFDELLNGFKISYAKLYNDQFLPNKSQIEPADVSWPKLKNSLDLSSMLAQLMNVHGNRLNYIYFVYRVASFDTHGNSMESLFNAAFNKTPCSFPVLDIEKIIELISNEYLAIWSKL